MKYIFLIVAATLLFFTAVAQPDEHYIKNLTGEIDKEWLTATGEKLSTQKIYWEKKKAPGFNQTSDLARLQFSLPHSWMFYPIDTTGSVSAGRQVDLPHKFEQKRNYKSGWYFSKIQLDKNSNKRYVLRLDRIQIFTMLMVNGQECKRHFGGYTPFETDITDALSKGENVIAIFVYEQSAALDGNKLYNQVAYTRLLSVYNQSGSTKEFPAGISGIPILEMREKAHIHDVFVKTSTRKNEMEIEYELGNDPDIYANSNLSFEVLKWPEGEKVDLDIPDVKLSSGSSGVQSTTVSWKNPKLWSPDHPDLYVLRTTLKKGKYKDVLETRFGFREFWVEGKSFMLNGIPTRLRGESYYYVVKNGRDFHREVFKNYKRLFGVNACRLHAFMPPGEVVEAADEAGILLDDQSAIWSENASYYKNGGEWFLKNTEIEFEEWARRDRNNPSVVIWDVENEMLRVSYEEHLPWVKKLPNFIKKLDNTRPFNNSGQGWVSEDQDMALLHMQEHYSKIMADWNERGTYPLICGEFWVGGRMEQRLPNSPELSSVYQRYVEEAKIYQEQMLEMRYRGISGVMPFRVSRLSFPESRSAVSYDFTAPDKLKVAIRSEEVIQKIKHGLQPVTVFFWPRQSYVSDEKNIKRELVICNDGETEEEFIVTWKWDGQDEKTKSFTMNPSHQERIVIDELVPGDANKLVATVAVGNKIVSSDTLIVNKIKAPENQVSKKIQVYKNEGLSSKLTEQGYEATSSESVPEVSDNVIWVIPDHANNRELNAIKDEILAFLEKGGNILCLKQDQTPTWFPVKFQFWSANQTSPHTYAMMGWEGLNKDLFFSSEAPIYAQSHPVFVGLKSKTLHVWNKFDGRVSDDVFTRPSNVNIYEQGNWRPLAGGTRREHSSLSEIFYGKGILLSCQLHVIDNLDNIQAGRLFSNMIQYLSDPPMIRRDRKVKASGSLSEKISDIVGMNETILEGAIAEEGDLMIATEGADLMKVKQWAQNGGKVIVLSQNLVKKFEGVDIVYNEETNYMATQVEDHPLLYGVSSGNFIYNNGPKVRGFFRGLPKNATVLLQGFEGNHFWNIKEAGPVMISIPYGKGEILLSSIEIESSPSAATKEFLGLLLTNSGVRIPFNQVKKEEVSIKKTVPISIDGKLNEWLEDMEDRYVTQYIHAQPIHLTSESIVEGPPEFDLNLSAINYFMWDEKALYIAGVVFSEEKTFESGVHLGAKKKYTIEFLYNDDRIVLDFKNEKPSISVNGKSTSNVKVATSKVDSKNLTDATVLQFNYILKSGKIAILESLEGGTFEMSIPWDELNSKSSDREVKSLIRIESKGSKIQVPLSADSSAKDKWMDMKITQ